MIGRIRGVLVSAREDRVCVDVGGVGYEVTMTPRDLTSLPGVGEEVVVHVHTHVREDEISLYGFVSSADRDLYRVLLTANGVGPKVALGLLGSLSGDEIVRAITAGDPDALTVAPGVGKRGAQKIVLELAPKLSSPEVGLSAPAGLSSVRQALEGLGYTTAEINMAIGELNPKDPVEDQIKAALQNLGSR
ncbi:MAG: Holliday junction branch migration protein RuvA [Acidimicrobiia bacterium]